MKIQVLTAGLLVAVSSASFAQGTAADRSKDAAGRGDNKEAQQQAGSTFDGNKALNTTRPHLKGSTPEVNDGSVPDMINDKKMRGNEAVFPNGTGCKNPPKLDADIPATYMNQARKVKSTDQLAKNAQYYRQLLGVCQRKDEIMNKSCRPAVTNPVYAAKCEADKKFVTERCGMSPEEMQKGDWVMRACEFEVTMRDWKRARSSGICGKAENEL